jgi:hypothetical protein
MRVFKNKWFARWTRTEGVQDAVLLQAAAEIIAGQVEADLGGGLFKKRLTRQGSGKRSGYRVLIGYKKPNTERIVFLYSVCQKCQGHYFRQESGSPEPGCRGFCFGDGCPGEFAFGERFPRRGA